MVVSGAGPAGNDDGDDQGEHPETGKESNDQELEGLAEQMSELARSLQAEENPQDVLAHLVGAAIELVPGADEGSISVVEGRRDVQSQAPSSDLPEQVDALQSEFNQGPCLDAVYEHGTVSVPDMASEQRWPDFSRRAAELGAASMLSFQLYVEGDNLGALNLYGRKPDAFTEESEQVGLLIASHAAIAFADTRKLGQMRDAMRSRDVIGQAKGILMERYGITAQNAFIMLTQTSSHTNTKLLDVAEHLASTGALPSRRRHT
jgi:transcriptional regulator with GAF, ATPase, and Fis domain